MFLGEKIKRKEIAFVRFVHFQNIEIVGVFFNYVAAIT